MELKATYENSGRSSRQVSPLPERNKGYRWHNEYFTKDYGLKSTPATKWDRFKTGLKFIGELTGAGAGLTGVAAGANYVIKQYSNRKSQPVKVVGVQDAPVEIYGYDSTYDPPGNSSDLSKYYTPTPTPSPEVNKGQNPMNNNNMDNT